MSHDIYNYLFPTFSLMLSLVFISFIIRSKRAPGNTLAWLIFILVLPYIGIPIFLFLCDRKFHSRITRKHQLYAANAKHLSDDMGMIDKILATLGVPDPHAHQQAQLITSGEEAYYEMLRLIEGAKHSIRLTTYIFEKDEVGRAFLSLLEKKAEEGVEVTIILDSFGTFLVHSSFFNGLRSKGGKVAYFNPVFHLPWRGRSNFRNHRKLLIIDSVKAVLGGMNISRDYMGPTPDPKRWKDLAFIIHGSSVADVEAVFYADWLFVTEEELKPPAPCEEEVKGDSNIQVVAGGPDAVGDPLYDTILALIYRATKRVWIATPYFIPDESLTKALELAARRGVDVQILIPRRSDHKLADLARGSYLRQLHKAGCRISLVKKMMHGKAMAVDDQFALIGSANFDMRSLLLNYEIGVFLREGAPVTDLRDWFQDCFRNGLSFRANVGYWRDIAEGVGRVLGPFI